MASSAGDSAAVAAAGGAGAGAAGGAGAAAPRRGATAPGEGLRLAEDVKFSLDKSFDEDAAKATR